MYNWAINLNTWTLERFLLTVSLHMQSYISNVKTIKLRTNCGLGIRLSPNITTMYWLLHQQLDNSYLYLHLIKYTEIVCCVEFYKLIMLPHTKLWCTKLSLYYILSEKKKHSLAERITVLTKFMMDSRRLESASFFNVSCAFCSLKPILWNRVALSITDRKTIKGENEIRWEKEEKRSLDPPENSHMHEMNKA